MPSPKGPTKTIDEVLDEFLDEQEARWSPATYRKYEAVVDLLKAYTERYWPGHDGEYERVTKVVPCLLALRAKGYTLTLSFTKGPDGSCRAEYDAVKGDRAFSATTAQELLGLVAMWEVRGDDWRTRQGEPWVSDDLYPSAVTYDLEGNALAVGGRPVG